MIRREHETLSCVGRVLLIGCTERLGVGAGGDNMDPAGF